jgi:serine/threonine protein kinase
MKQLLIAFLQDQNTLSDVYSLGCVYFEMLTLLKGESIQSMRQFFSDNGMKSMVLRTNLVVANLWLDKLLVKHTDDYDNEPITWIRGKIERSPERRPSSEELAHWTIGTANASRFCCPSCMDEDEVSSQDELLPQQSRDITNGLGEFPTHPQTAGPIAQTNPNVSWYY